MKADGKWTEVKKSNKRDSVHGKKGDSTTLKRKIQGKASRVMNDTSTEHMKEYLASVGISSIEMTCVSKPIAAYKSFKLCVPVTLKDKVMNETLWPSGVCVKKWSEKNPNRVNGT